MTTLEQRFWGKVQKTSACWLWTASFESSGYGNFWVRPKMDKAHRVAWRLTHGQIPDGQYVLHKCDVRACVNPDHLFLGTCKDNVEDMYRKGRDFHPTLQKTMDADSVKRLYALIDSGEFTQVEIGKQLGIVQGAVSYWVSKRGAQ